MLWVIKQTNKQPHLHFIEGTYKSHPFSSLQLVDPRICVKDQTVSSSNSDCFKQL